MTTQEKGIYTMRGIGNISKLNLVDGWQVRYEEMAWGPQMAAAVLDKNEGWMNAALPCDVHQPLTENRVIKEPLEADNFFGCKWVENKSWWFKKAFEVGNDMLKEDVAELVIESLDAEADIFLNSLYLGHHRSAHYPFKKEVRDILKTDDNILLIRVTSGLEHVNEQELSSLEWLVSTEAKDDRGDKRRAFVRKPQYVYGWDWGPRVATCGIMKGAYIEFHSSLAVRGVHAVTESVGGNAVIGLEVEVENLRPYSTMEGTIKVDVLYRGEKVANARQDELFRSGLNYIYMPVTVADAKLWWPNGMGEQPLYEIHVYACLKNGDCDAYPIFKYGIRTLKLNLNKLNKRERLFAFEINGVRIFCKGGDWIPADSIYARVTDEKYDTLIWEAREANFNMLRIWGGGIYERDIFYEKCDEYGILLWHDFMFGCSLYPDHLEWFRNEVEREIDYQTRRLRNHASIALWCGNNENQWIYKNWWINGRNPLSPGGLTCYNEMAPRIVRHNCSNIPYWNSSPYGGEDPNDNEIGDRHHWHDCTMNPDMEKRITPEEYDKVNSMFITEYGYIGPCRKSSILKYHADIAIDRKGHIWQLHNNTFEKEIVPAGIAKHYGDPDKLDIDQYLLYAGLCQGMMLEYSLEAIRVKPNCSGALFWMYDDCWGEVGWTIIDYYLKRKISYYFVKRAFEPIKLIMRESDGMVKVTGINDTAEVVAFDIECGYMDFKGRKNGCNTSSVSLAPYSRKIILKFEKGHYDFTRGFYYVSPVTEHEHILPAVLRPGNFKELDVPDTSLKIFDFKSEGDMVTFTVNSENYAHAVHFNLDDSIRLSDEYFDLLPGESRVVQVFDVPVHFSAEDLKPQYVLRP